VERQAVLPQEPLEPQAGPGRGPPAEQVAEPAGQAFLPQGLEERQAEPGPVERAAVEPPQVPEVPVGLQAVPVLPREQATPEQELAPEPVLAGQVELPGPALGEQRVFLPVGEREESVASVGRPVGPVFPLAWLPEPELEGPEQGLPRALQVWSLPGKVWGQPEPPRLQQREPRRLAGPLRIPAPEHSTPPVGSNGVAHRAATTTCTRTHSPQGRSTASRPSQTEIASPWSIPPVKTETCQQNSTRRNTPQRPAIAGELLAVGNCTMRRNLLF